MSSRISGRRTISATALAKSKGHNKLKLGVKVFFLWSADPLQEGHPEVQ